MGMVPSKSLAPVHPHSLPATPTSVRTFQDFSQEHTRLLTTLHGSTGTLEVNGLGGFYGKNGNGSHGMGGASYAPSTIEPVMNGYGKYHDPTDMINHVNPTHQFHSGRSHSVGGEEDLTDVLQGLSLNGKEQGRGYPGGYIPRPPMIPPMRRSSVPAQNGPMMGWAESIIEESPVFTHNPTIQQSKLMSGFSSVNPVWNPASGNHGNGFNPPPPAPPTTTQQNPPSIWSPTFSSRPESELSSYVDSDGSNGFSPIYSPVSAVTSGFFEPFPVVSSSANQYQVQTSATQFMVSMFEIFTVEPPNKGHFRISRKLCPL